jgi:hypothetical protein
MVKHNSKSQQRQQLRNGGSTLLSSSIPFLYLSSAPDCKTTNLTAGDYQASQGEAKRPH